MARFTLFLALTCLAGLTAAHALRPHDHFVRQRRASRYKLVHDLAAQSVLDFWRFEEKVDASARYVSQEEGKHLGLISVGSYNTVRLGCVRFRSPAVKVFDHIAASLPLHKPVLARASAFRLATNPTAGSLSSMLLTSQLAAVLGLLSGASVKMNASALALHQFYDCVVLI